MKPERPGDSAGDAFSRRLAELSGQLRDEGVPPARDLWTDLERALDSVTATGVPPRPARWSLTGGGPWLTAALAATVLVLVGFGVVGRGTVPGTAPGAHVAAQPAPEIAPAAAAPLEGPAATRLGLRAVDAALDELQAALERSPDDPGLSRLVLMIHHSRGRLLRLQADNGARDAFRGPG
jgi:hypothetical protein